MKTILPFAALSIVLMSWPKTAAAQCAAFAGRATVFQANGVGIVPVVLSDTGNLDSTGGAKEASLLNASVPGLVSGEVLHATAIAEGSYSRAESSVANLVLTVGGNTIGADFVMARANSFCGSGIPTIDGNTEIDGLVINGQSINVTGLTNQSISLPGGGFIIINEQNGSVQGQTGSITVNALHVTVPGLDVVVAADPVVSVGPFVAVVPPPGGCDFVTGGGWIPPEETPSGGGKGTFGVAGGMNKGNQLWWGHLEYQDHGTGMNVHGTGVLNYFANPPGSNSREIWGSADKNGQSGSFYIVDVTDNGEPGRNDVFQIKLFDSLDALTTCANMPQMCMPAYTAGGTLGGGNIKLHSNSNSCS
jgi:hypothetical protein